MSRVSIRLRLTATFALAMAVVLAAAGLLLYDVLAGSLDRTLAQGLRTRAADVAALVQQADTGLRESRLDARNRFAQVLTVRGRIFDHTLGLGRAPLLTPVQLARASAKRLIVDRLHVGDGDVRLLALPVAAQGRRLVVVVGAPLETRDNALTTLRTELLAGAPVALLLASLLGYLIAAGALRPVERMRGRAAAISASRLSDRLPVPASHDENSRLGETLNEMLTRLQTALERERSFVADASHELRTPLSHLRAEVELALETPREPAELVAALQSIGAETDRLSQLATDLLLLARVDDGSLPIRREEVDVYELLAGVATRFERRARDSGRAIAVGAAGRANVDRLRIEQALGNLVENGLRYGAGTIRLSATEADGRLELHVTDEGPGFPPGFAERAFERFSRVDESRANAGAGLGLAIVAAIAAAHEGTAAVTARAEGGAQIVLRMPSASARPMSSSL